MTDTCERCHRRRSGDHWVSLSGECGAHLPQPASRRAVAAEDCAAARYRWLTAEVARLQATLEGKMACSSLPDGFYAATGCDQTPPGEVFYFRVLSLPYYTAPHAWGFSIYRRARGYRTLGIPVADWLALPANAQVRVTPDYDRCLSLPNATKTSLRRQRVPDAAGEITRLTAEVARLTAELAEANKPRWVAVGGARVLVAAGQRVGVVKYRGFGAEWAVLRADGDWQNGYCCEAEAKLDAEKIAL